MSLARMPLKARQVRPRHGKRSAMLERPEPAPIAIREGLKSPQQSVDFFDALPASIFGLAKSSLPAEKLREDLMRIG
jgi:hypothetical protein